MSATLQAIHAYLLELAQTGHDPITYTELARHFDMLINSEADVGLWSDRLGDVSRAEHARGNPLLSVIIINDEKNRPGGGFYDLARSKGLFQGHNEFDKLAFYSQELKRVYLHWHGKMP
jgi:hypothetical protein